MSDFRERILFIGDAGSGKTTQLLYIVKYLGLYGIRCHVIDFEDKVLATLGDTPVPDNMDLYVTRDWERLQSGEKHDQGGLMNIIEYLGQPGRFIPGEWLMCDRFDLTWGMVQDWYCYERYGMSMTDRLLESAKSMGKKSSMVVGGLDKGGWQVINSQYNYAINQLIYKFKAHLLFTAGVKEPDEVSVDTVGRVLARARGQKELEHEMQSNFVFDYSQDLKAKETWVITTKKEGVGGRERLKQEDMTNMNFAIRYLAKYYHP